ncbi:MAG: ATP-binding protein [Planctomycetota bacterium]
MKHNRANKVAPSRRSAIRLEDSVRLSREILHCANRGLLRVEFLREVSKMLIDSADCDAIEVRLNDGDLHYRWEATRHPESGARFDLVRWTVCDDGRVIPASQEDSDLERLCRNVAGQHFDASLPSFTRNGSFWTGDAWQSLPLGADAGRLCVGGHYRSLAIIRFFVDEHTIGLLHIKSQRPDCFTEEGLESFEGIAQALGLAVADRRAQAALRERVKELTCLYGIAQVAETEDTTLEEMLQRIVSLLPPAWQYPEIAAARITLDSNTCETPRFRDSKHRQAAEIVVGDRRRGVVEVVYLEERPEFAVSPFLTEEVNLIDAVAREVAQIVERSEAEEVNSKLQQQLIHADRLATIGQLAAGVAHELNEPLGSILGFAQLIQKCSEIPEQAEQDIQKIIKASLYTREVIKKLLVFARQMPPKKAQVNLNQVVEEGMYFLEARCTKGGIKVIRELAADLAEITADPAHLNQVLVNLVVNAVQAMPNGGTLTIRTKASSSFVLLIVEDTGIGMSEETLEKAFLPFFTTKDVNEGTGLGLAVVHGIVTSHGGSIDVESGPGQGTQFKIRLPVVGSEATQGTDQDGAHG